MNNYKNPIIVFLFCLLFAAGIGVKINDFRQQCSSLKKSGEPSVITQSHFDQYFVKDIELHHNCKLSRSTLLDELFQLKKINRNVYSFDIENKGKINDLYDSSFSLTISSSNSFSAIPILSQCCQRVHSYRCQ